MKLTHYLNPGPGALLACRLLVEKYCLLLGGRNNLLCKLNEKSSLIHLLRLLLT